jgi:hypothetical protein
MSDWERGRSQNREIATLRKRYADHRETVSRLLADAPTERLAQSYARLRAEIDAAIAKIDEIDGAAAGPIELKTVPQPAAPSTHPALRGAEEEDAPLTIDQDLLRDDYIETPERRRFPAAAVVAAILVVLLLVAFVVWRFARTNEPADTIVEEATTAVPSTIAEEPVPPTVAPRDPLAVTPEQYDYGIVRKGTRKSQKFTLTNNSEAPLVVTTSRSQCRCLWFEHPASIPPGGSGSLTITVDGARAKSGPLSEVVQIGVKDRADLTAEVEVRGTVQ